MDIIGRLLKLLLVLVLCALGYASPNNHFTEPALSNNSDNLTTFTIGQRIHLEWVTNYPATTLLLFQHGTYQSSGSYGYTISQGITFKSEWWTVTTYQFSLKPSEIFYLSVNNITHGDWDPNAAYFNSEWFKIIKPDTTPSASAFPASSSSSSFASSSSSSSNSRMPTTMASSVSTAITAASATLAGASSTSRPKLHHHSGLSKGAQIGLGVGVGVGAAGLLVGSTIAFMYHRLANRQQQHRQPTAEEPGASLSAKAEWPSPGQVSDPSPEMIANRPWTHELDSERM